MLSFEDLLKGPIPSKPFIKPGLMTKKLIIAIVGESGTGKSTASEMITETFNIEPVRSYTDRKKRDMRDTGHTFMSRKEFSSFIELMKTEIMLLTKFGLPRYCCLKSDIKELNVYVMNEEGLLELKGESEDSVVNYDYDVHSIRITRDVFLRLKDVSRERICRDREMFKIPVDYFDYVINNDHSKEEFQRAVLDAVSQILKEHFIKYHRKFKKGK
jgi:guanylate kinase